MLSSAVLMLAAVVGQADGGKVLETCADLAVGGVWTATIDGEKLEHSYRWMDGRKFLLLEGKGGALPQHTVIGVDPATGKCTRWTFIEDGGFVSTTMTLQSEGVWKLSGSGSGPNGKIEYEGMLTTIDKDTVKEDVKRFTIGGKSPGPAAVIWKRSKQ